MLDIFFFKIKSDFPIFGKDGIYNALELSSRNCHSLITAVLLGITHIIV